MRTIMEHAHARALRIVMTAQLMGDYDNHMKYAAVCVWCNERLNKTDT